MGVVFQDYFILYSSGSTLNAEFPFASLLSASKFRHIFLKSGCFETNSILWSG